MRVPERGRPTVWVDSKWKARSSQGAEIPQYPPNQCLPFLLLTPPWPEASSLLLKWVSKPLKSGSWNVWKLWSLQCYTEVEFKGSLPAVTCMQVLSSWRRQQYLRQMQQEKNSLQLRVQALAGTGQEKGFRCSKAWGVENVISCVSWGWWGPSLLVMAVR